MVKIYDTVVFDLIDLPIFFIILFTYLVFFKSSQKDTEDKKFIHLILFRGLFVIIHFLIQAFYYKFGDTFSYFKEASELWAATENLQDFFSIVFLEQEDLPYHLTVVMTNHIKNTFFTTKICYILGYFVFKSYLGISLLCSLFAFIGLNKIYEIIQQKFKDDYNFYFYLICCFPSTVFWSSLILKDTIAIGALGFLVYYTFSIFIDKKISIGIILKTIFFGFILISIKAYLLNVFVISLIFVIIAQRIISIRNTLFRYLIILFSIIIFYFTINNSIALISEFDLQQTLDATQNYQEFQIQFKEMGESGSVYTLDFEPTILGIIKIMPIAIFTSLFRPFIWEIKNFLMILQSLEGIFTFFIFYKVIKKHTLRSILSITKNNYLLFFSLTFVIFLALVTGITSFNFGTLARYKIPILPFLYFYLIFFYSQVTITTK